jgi:hypothetical protein
VGVVEADQEAAMIDKLSRLLRIFAAWFRRIERDAAAEITDKDIERSEDNGRIW